MIRMDLIGRTLRRELSCLLVMALLLVSAITFSTNEIPNFRPDCKTASVQKIPSTSTVAVARCLSAATAENDTSSAPIVPTIPAHVTPPADSFSLANTSRAPPEFLLPSSV
jgi:hypothetical protein